MLRLLLGVLATLFAAGASAQHAPGAHGPYAGLERRQIKALSEQQVADLEAGRGMGLALPAELNGYPGPMHVLELADRLSLSDAQKARVRALFDAMKAEAVPLGETLIAQEAELDRQFSARTITPASLAAITNSIGQTQAALRRVHLSRHLATLEILTPEQVRLYGELRGYASTTPSHGGHQRRHP
jgi:Spy/CpxP family protein refolding chaperone